MAEAHFAERLAAALKNTGNNLGALDL